MCRRAKRKNNMKNHILQIVILFLCAMTLCVQAQTAEPAKPAATPAPAPAPAKPSYQEMLEKVKKGDYGVDFKAMRFAFADTDASYSDSELAKKMNTALTEKDYKLALKTAQEQLEKSYINIRAHIVAYQAYKQQNKIAEADVHNKIAVALINSIVKDGDGLTPKTAWTVINVGEEYIVLSVLGYKVTSQSLAMEDGHSFDLMHVINNQTQEAAKFYFNVDKVFAGYTKAFKS